MKILSILPPLTRFLGEYDYYDSSYNPPQSIFQIVPQNGLIDKEMPKLYIAPVKKLYTKKTCQYQKENIVREEQDVKETATIIERL